MFKSKEFSKNEIYFFIILGLIHLGYFTYAILWGNIYAGDFREYLMQSVNLKEHLNWYTEVFKEPIQPDFFSRRPPMYAIFILTFKSIYNSDYTVLFAQSVLSWMNFYGLIKLLKRYNFKINVFKLLILFILLYPSQFIYCNFIMSEMLFQTFLFWSFYNFIRFTNSADIKYIVYYNLFISLALLTKPVLYMFWIINFFLMLYLFLKNRKNYAIILSGLIPAAVVLIICFYNYNVTGYFHYSSLRHNNFIEFHSNYIKINKEGFEKSVSEYKKNKAIIDTIRDYKTQSGEKERIALEYIEKNFGDYLKLYFKGVFNFFLDPGRFDISEFFRIKNTADTGIYYVYLREGYTGIINYILKLPVMFILFLTSVILINVIMIISMINFIFEKGVEIEIRIYFVLIIGYISFVTGIVGSLRYKLPLFQIILFSMPFLFDKIIPKFSKRKTIKKSSETI